MYKKGYDKKYLKYFDCIITVLLDLEYIECCFFESLMFLLKSEEVEPVI